MIKAEAEFSKLEFDGYLLTFQLSFWTKWRISSFVLLLWN